MKKITLAIFSIFVLAACSEDIDQETDKQIVDNSESFSGDSGGNTVYTYDSGLPGHSVPGIPGAGVAAYESPYSVTGGNGIMYHLINNTPYDIIITPHIGFFCYGSWVDVYWNGSAGAYTRPRLFTEGVNQKQYGNTLQIDPVKLPPWSSITHGPSTGRFPLNGASSGSSFTDSFHSYAETGPMMEIGELYFIKYEVPGVASGVLKQKIGNDAMDWAVLPGNWQQIMPTSPSTSCYLTYNSDLALIYQDVEPGVGPGSLEICLVNRPGSATVPSEVAIAGHTLSFVTDANAVYIIFQ